MFKKICAFTMLVCMVFSVVPTHAAIKVENLMDDLTYMDDVYKYDMNLFEKADSIDSEVAANNSRAVQAVLALGIMEKNKEGKFLPDEYITLGDFASIVLRLISGSGDVTQEWYANYDSTEFTTQAMAAKYIVSALGYTVFEKKYDTAYPEMSVATQLNLFRGIAQKPEAYITRMELAQVIYNSLSVSLFKQTSFGSVAEYGVDEGATLLSEKFNAIEITGTLSGVSGINLYSSAKVENERIIIDRTEYILKNGEDYSSLIGKRVLAYAKRNENSDIYEIIGVMQHEQDESIELSLDKVQSITKSEIIYDKDGKRKKLSVNNVQTVLYNGSSMKNYTFSSELLAYEGSILLGKSGKGGAYDIAVIYAMESYPVARVTSLDKKVYFKYGMKFENSAYLDLNDEDNDKKIVVLRDGVPAKATDIQVQDIVSIAKSADGSYIRVLASSKTATGTIVEMTSDGAAVLESGASYYISKTYQDEVDKAILNNTTTELKEIKLGTAGTYYISASGRIADCVVSGEPAYALLKQIGAPGTSLEKTPMIRVFTESQQWINYELSAKLTLDGAYTSREKAYEIMEEYRDVIVMQPIRYRVSENGKITFLDTMIDTTEEKTDPKRIYLDYVYTDFQIDWTLGENLRPTNYNLTNNTIMFSIPTDRTNEKKYKVIRRYDLVKEDRPQLSLYSPNEFYTVPVVLYEGASYQGGWEGGWVFAVNNVFHSTNENGEDVCVIKGMIRKSSNNNSYWAEEELEVKPEALEMAPTLSKGDVIWYILNSDGAVDKMKVRLEDATLPEVDILENPGAGGEFATGVVTAVDLKGKQIKMDINTGTEDNPVITTRVLQSGDICIYDSTIKKYYPALLADLNIGDRVLVSGLVRKINAVVYR
ncbi:MAG: S-layer homology domain-containing protein [Clostridia bacterium]|nr:S-layer homology domain-containing protein [Clostridia bacterium]